MAVTHETTTHLHEHELHSRPPHQHLEEGHGEEHDHEHAFELVEVLRVLFVALAAAAVWFHLWEPFHRLSVIGLAATLIGGYPIFKEAVENIIERRMTMELSTVGRGRRAIQDMLDFLPQVAL